MNRINSGDGTTTTRKVPNRINSGDDTTTTRKALNRINSGDYVRNRADEPPTKQPRLEESERLKMVVGVEGEGSAVAKPRQPGIITKEELDKMKFKACAICGVADKHATSRCPWRQGCPSTNIVGPDAEIVCWCCEEDVTIVHPNEYIIGRARLKDNYFQNIRPPLSSLPRQTIVTNF